MTEEPSAVKINKKPKWLKILEKQSWQAELLVSGLAIVGSFQLPGLVSELTDYLLASLPYSMMGNLPYFFVWYLIIAVSGLMLNFIIHFALRALWIGMVGLVSVFPEGIKRREDLYSRDFNDKLAKRFPDINAFNQRLDDLCSIIFAVTFQFFMIFASFSLMIASVTFLMYVLNSIVPIDIPRMSAIVLGIIWLGLVTQGILNLKSLREKKWVRNLHFPMNQFFSKLLFNVFYKPTSYISLTLNTNAPKRTTFPIFAIVYTFFLLIVVLPQLRNSNLFQFRESRFFTENHDPSVVSYKNYEDQRQGNQRILETTIPSATIVGPSLRVFLPDLRREREAYFELWPEWEDKDDLSRSENEKASTSYYLEGHHAYHQFYLNDSLITDVQSFHFTHPNRQEDGKISYLPTKYCKEGPNVLKIVKAYTNEEGEKKEIYIPFIFRNDK